MASDANARSRARRHPLHTGWGRAAASSNARGTIGHNQQQSETIGHNQQQSGEGNNWAQSAAISSNQDHKQRLARPSWPITAITANINQRWFWVDQHPAPPPFKWQFWVDQPPPPRNQSARCAHLQGHAREGRVDSIMTQFDGCPIRFPHISKCLRDRPFPCARGHFELDREIAREIARVEG